nr:hypothetical protein BHI3_12000 [Bacteriovorax sp. HI3]
MKINITLLMLVSFSALMETHAASVLLYSPGKIHSTKKATSTSSTKESATKASAAVSTSTSSAVDPAVMAQIEKDFNSALNGAFIPELGDSMSWAGGTLTRTKKGELRYVNTNNGYYEATLKSTADIPKLARENSDINNTWIAQYGVDIGNLTNDNAQNQQDAYRTSISHVATHGLLAQYNKDNPWKFDKGIAAYNENGNTIFTLKGKVVSMYELQNSNEYKALTGANVLYEEKQNAGQAQKTTAAVAPTSSSSVGNMDYIKSVTNSSIEMLIEASKKYKAGSLSKDQYIEVALQVGAMADYNKKVDTATKANGNTSASAPASSASGSASEKGWSEKTFGFSSSEQTICAQNPQFAICRPPAERLQYLKDQVAKAQKPISLNFIASFGPGFDGSEQVFADWTNTSKTFIVSCDEGMNSYGLFSGEKGKTGPWKAGSNRKFYDTSGNYIGEGGALITVTQYVDKATGAPMVEPNIFYPAVGYCQK